MRLWSPLFAFAVLGLVGCSGSPDLRPEPVDVKVTIKPPAGSAKDLTVSFNPTEDGLPIGGKVGPGGTVTVKAIPGKYIVFFPEDSNASIPAYKQVPARYRTANQDHVVTLAAAGTTIEVK
jgi:hypothetical protein